MKFDYTEFLKRRSIEDGLSGVKVKYSNSIYRIKNQLSFTHICKFIDSKLFDSKKFIVKLFGNPLPTSYSDLGFIGKNERVYNAQTLQAEVNWTLICIRKYKKEIALFIEYRKIFENAFILGDYKIAERYLNKIETEICHSIWSLEKRLLLLEFQDSPEAHKSFLSDTNKIAKGFLIPSLLQFISNRSEKSLSVSRYNLDVYNSLERIKGDTAQESREFYYFKVNKFEYSEYSNLKDVLTYDGYHSVIDRYISLITILKITLSDSNTESKLKEFIRNRIQYLTKKFDDSNLQGLYNISFPNDRKEFTERYDVEILDLFVSGLYEECISKLTQKLKEHPSEIDYYVLYVQSFIYLKRPFVLPINIASFQNNLLNEIFLMFNRKIAPYESLINLQRIIKNLYGFKLSEGLYGFLNDKIQPHSIWSKFALLSLNFNNPAIVDFYDNKDEIKEYLKFLSGINSNSIAVHFNKIKLEEHYEKSINELNIPSLIKKVELAKFYQSNLLFEQAKTAWSEVATLSTHITPIYEAAIKNLFDTYVELEELDNAVNLFVDNYMSSSFIVFDVDVSKIREKIRRKKFKNVTPTIELVLFYTFSKADENELHIAYERFNYSIGIEKPSEISTDHTDIDKQKLIAYLHLTCTTEIFKHSIYINGSKEGYSERILVCKKLLSIDEINANVYKTEINELTDALIIQEGLQQLDESKIYVNEQGLLNSELKEFEGLYNRYRTIANIYKKSDKQLLLYDKRRGVRLASVKDLTDSISKEQYSSDPLRDAFEDIFDVITRKFLFSKFGISAYLSTRIRHGVLLGEIRPIFEKYNLISQKDSTTNTYQDIDYWNEVYHNFTDLDKEKLQSILKSFSEFIDKTILDLLKDNIQIKTEDENPEGWFDYYFDDNKTSLWAIKCMQAKDYGEFVKLIIEILWLRTDENLDQIRKRIQDDLKSKFNDAIRELTSKLQNKLNWRVSEVYTSINTCLTDIQNTLDRITSWFNRSGSQTSDFGLDKLISIVLENISHSYSKRQLSLKKFEVATLTIKGEFYTHFADLFRIFLDNALKHSDQSMNIIDIDIYAWQEDDKLMITIKNSHPNTKSLLEIVDHSNNEINLKKLSTEGKSGFPKADKIIRSDLKNESNTYKFFIDEEKQFTVILIISLENLIA